MLSIPFPSLLNWMWYGLRFWYVTKYKLFNILLLARDAYINDIVPFFIEQNHWCTKILIISHVLFILINCHQYKLYLKLGSFGPKNWYWSRLCNENPSEGWHGWERTVGSCPCWTWCKLFLLSNINFFLSISDYVISRR